MPLAPMSDTDAQRLPAANDMCPAGQLSKLIEIRVLPCIAEATRLILYAFLASRSLDVCLQRSSY